MDDCSEGLYLVISYISLFLACEIIHGIRNFRVSILVVIEKTFFVRRRILVSVECRNRRMYVV